MAKKNLFNAETIMHNNLGSLVIEKKAVFSYVRLVPSISAHGKSVPLSNKGFGIGRDKNNAVIVSDPKVSKFHAYVTFKKGTAYIRDAGSTNGTWLNKERISDQRATALKNRDTIVVGSTQIIFKC